MENLVKRAIAVLMVILMSFSVIAYVGNSDFTVSAASAKTISIKKKPTLKASKIKATTVKLSWSKTKGATSYKVYKSTDKKKWTLVTKTKKTSYTVKKLNGNKKYYFRVKAYKTTNGKTTKSPYSKAITVRTKKTQSSNSNLTLPKNVYFSRNHNNQIKISWTKVSGADGFRIYQYDEQTGKWIKIEDIKKRSYTVDSLKAGTTYKFAIRPYKKLNGEFIFSKAKKEITTSTLPNTVKNIKTEFIDKTTLKVSWKKQDSKTVKYEVYYTTSFGAPYRLAKTTSKNSCLIKGLNKNKGYVVYVVAFNMAGDEKIFGEQEFVTVPKNITNKYNSKEGKYIEYELVEGKWKKTIQDAYEENGVIYSVDYNGIKRPILSEDLVIPGDPKRPTHCEDCGKPSNECAQCINAYYCGACKKTIKAGECHPNSHFEKYV